ncbi:MAG: hypothetical protein LBU34_11450 [Planctomycetaceae bacterium]|jgi:hypothetical protein|nr:hypothetical protein [Planctomycetaceae bacterium]
MAVNRGYVPRRDGEFFAWARTIHRHCLENAATWLLDAVLLEQFENLLENANEKFKKNSDLSKRNRESVAEKNAAFAALKQFLKLYINLLEGNARIPDQSILEMGLRPRHRAAPHPKPVPTTSPVLSARVLHHYEIDTYVSSLQHAHPTQSLTDEKYKGFMLRYKFEGETEWKTVISTKLHYLFVFTEKEVGKRITMQAAWVNPRIQPGPWSDEVTEIIT